MRVHGQPLEPEVQEAGHRLQPRVGQGLGQQQVARLQQRRQDDREPVLAAGADEHVLGRRGDPAAPDPGRPGLAVGRVPPGRRVVEQAPDVFPGGQAGDRAQERGSLRAPWRIGRVVLPEVDRPVVVRGIELRVVPAADERPASHLARHQAPASGLRVRPAHRPHGDAELVGQVAVGGQTTAHPQVPRRNVLGKSVDDGLVPGSLASLEPGLPDCHGVNIAIDTLDCQL